MVERQFHVVVTLLACPWPAAALKQGQCEESVCSLGIVAHWAGLVILREWIVGCGT